MTPMARTLKAALPEPAAGQLILIPRDAGIPAVKFDTTIRYPSIGSTLLARVEIPEQFQEAARAANEDARLAGAAFQAS